MKRLDRYILTAQIPYILLALAVLNAMLLLQQLTRFADTLDEANSPFKLAYGILLNLLPGLLLFTIPMSALVGASVGFSRLSSDSEVTAIGTAGVSPLRILYASVVHGVFMSFLTFFVGFGLVPEAGRELREIAIRAAIERAESPVSPGSFYSVGDNKVIFVREGDRRGGKWNKVFINWREKDGSMRLITARTGWLDFSDDRTELVLQDSVISTIPTGILKEGRSESITSERSAILRIRDDRLGQGRRDLIEKFRNREPGVDELGWGDLLKVGNGGASPEIRREARIALHKRLSLCLAPLLFALLGSVLGTRVGRGGRANGVVLSLVVMLLYYLLSLAAEQMARAGRLSVTFGVWLPSLSFFMFGIFMLYGRRWGIYAFLVSLNPFKRALESSHATGSGGLTSFNVPSLLDYTVVKQFVYYLVLIALTLVSIFYIFTLFELTRFIIPNSVEFRVVLKYFFYLIPYTLNAVMPISTLLGAIVALALLARRSEVVAWLSAGQSAYRILLPCMLFAAFLGLNVFLLGEHVLPYANRKQNELRMMIRGGSVSGRAEGGLKWISTPERFNTIYSFKNFEDGRFDYLTVYELDEENIHLKRILVSERADAAVDGALDFSDGVSVDLDGVGGGGEQARGKFLDEVQLSFLKQMNKRPDELNEEEIRAVIQALRSRGDDPRIFSVALERRRADPFFPLIMTLVGAPMALAFGRRSPIVPIFLAILVVLLFLGVAALLGEAGARGLLPPKVAGWSGLFIFGTFGLMLLSRVKT